MDNDQQRLDELVTRHCHEGEEALGLEELMEMDRLIEKLTDESEHGRRSLDGDV